MKPFAQNYGSYSHTVMKMANGTRELLNPVI